jgi:hypothetical protein
MVALQLVAVLLSVSQPLFLWGAMEQAAVLLQQVQPLLLITPDLLALLAQIPPESLRKAWEAPVAMERWPLQELYLGHLVLIPVSAVAVLVVVQLGHYRLPILGLFLLVDLFLAVCLASPWVDQAAMAVCQSQVGYLA